MRFGLILQVGVEIKRGSTWSLWSIFLPDEIELQNTKPRRNGGFGENEWLNFNNRDYFTFSMFLEMLLVGRNHDDGSAKSSESR